MSTSTTTVSNVALGLHGFTFEAITPSGRKFLLAVVHAPKDTSNAADLVIGTVGGSCFFAHVIELTAGSESNPSVFWAYDDSHNVISHLDTL